MSMAVIVSRVRLFTPDPTSIAAAISIAASAPIEQVRVSRLDGSAVTAQVVTVNDTVIEVVPGDVAAPAVIELRVADLNAAITSSVAAGFPISISRTGAARITLGDVVIPLREVR
jgi:hypothetical protein